MSEFNQAAGVARIVRAFGYSVQGLRACFRHEAAFRKALLVGSWLLVMIVELLNSAVEATVDRFGPERHELSGRAKDIGSAAVLLAIGLAILVWALLLWPRVM